MNKSKLRAQFLDKQKSHTEPERIEKSQLISNRFFSHFKLDSILFLQLFMPILKNNEVETSFILERLRKEFPKIECALPRVNFDSKEIESVLFETTTKLEENRWDILEPIEGEIIAPEKLDVVLVPLLCFDRLGFRVGYGKGFYDRFLKRCRADCKKIGLSFFEPAEEISDAEEFDVALDFAVTPQEIYNF